MAQFSDSEQVVCRARYKRGHLGFRLSDEAALSHSTDRLEPAKYLFDSFAPLLAASVALGSRRTAVEPWCFSILDSCNVRSNFVLAQLRNEVLHVIALVRRQALGVNPATPGASEHLTGCTVLRLRRFGHQNVHAQAVAVLHEHMAAVAEFGRLPVAFAHEARFWIGRALVRRVRALLALEVDHAPAVAAIRGRLAVLALETLERGPGVDQRAVNGEMIGRQQALTARKTNDFIEEATRDIGHDQALAQTAEIRLIQAGALQVHVEKPAEQDVVIELLAKLTVRANRVQRDEQLPLEQTFRRNRRATDTRVLRVELRRYGAKRPIRQLLDRSQRMIRRYARLGREVVEHRGLGIELAAHRSQDKSFGSTTMTIANSGRSLGFASTC